MSSVSSRSSRSCISFSSRFVAHATTNSRNEARRRSASLPLSSRYARCFSNRLLQLLDAIASGAIATGHHDGREPRVGVELVPDLEDRTHLRGGVLGLRVVGLVYAEHVRYLHDAGLESLHGVPRPWLQAKHHRVRSRGDLDLTLPHPHRLVEHHVHPCGLHRHRGEPWSHPQVPPSAPCYPSTG